MTTKTSAAVGVIVVAILAFTTGMRASGDPLWLTAVSLAIVVALIVYTIRTITK